MAKQLRLALFYNIDLGGAKRVVYENIKGLSERGHLIDIYTLENLSEDFWPPEPFVHKVFRFSYRWFEPQIRIPGLSKYIIFFINLINLLRLNRLQRLIAAQIDAGSYDLVYVHKCNYTFSPYLLRHLKTPIIYFFPEPPREFYEAYTQRRYPQQESFRFKLWRLYYRLVSYLWTKILKRVDRKNLLQADLWLVNSYYSREVAYRVYGVLAKVCYHGVAIEKFKPEPALSKENMVISVGGYNYIKGFSFIIEALALISPGQRPKVVFVGDRSYLPEKQYLDNLAREKGLDCQFWERIPEEKLVELYNKAKLLVYAPIMEPFGLVVLEAMACGLPVVSVKEAGPRESIVDGQTGLLVDRDPKEFAEAVEKLLLDQDLRLSLGEKARDYALKKWNWQVAIEELEKIIYDFLGESYEGKSEEGPPSHTYLGKEQKEAVQTFDVFDTLIGRWYYHPYSIFEEVEKISKVPNFKKWRIKAEKNCQSKTYQGIYDSFQQLSGLDRDKLTYLRELEYELEEKLSFPIIDNLRKVSQGDLVVSDTYLSRSQIKKLLLKNGLKTKNKIFVSYDGKQSGRLWGRLSKKYNISSHLGNNYTSDYKTPLSYNIPSVYYKDSGLCGLELSLEKMGQQRLAYFMRMLRLLNPFEKSDARRHLWNEGCAVNIPVLVLASFYLDRLLKKLNKSKVLFTTRDCHNWKKVFSSLFPHYTAITYQSSRKCYYEPSQDYIGYVKGLYDDKCMIVDLQGSGTSCFHFYERYFKTHPCYFILVDSRPQFRKRGKYFLVNQRQGISDKIEFINKETCGYLIDVKNNQPLRSEPRGDEFYLKPYLRCVDLAIRYLGQGYALNIGKPNIPQLVKHLLLYLEKNIAISDFVKHIDEYPYYPWKEKKSGK